MCKFNMALLALMASLFSLPTLAVDNGPFELDGNAVDNTGAAPPDDWSTLINGGSAFVTTIDPNTGNKPNIADPSPKSIFTGGGSKDVNNIDQWRLTDGSVPDKDDITNAYAAAYNVSGDLVIYFGADRLSNDGDAQLGFWFFQNNITLDQTAGKFIGTHAAGDLLVLVNFSGGGDTPTIQVFEWNTSVKNNLKLLTTASVKCDGVGGKSVCAITNNQNETAPWPYAPKPNIGAPGTFPPQTFFEGGINISQLLGSNRCFTTFLAETRSSTSVTAQLKDFVIGSFGVCGVKMSKVCQQGGFNSQTGKIENNYQVIVENIGFAAVDGITVVDDQCTPGNTSDDITTPVTLAAKGSPGDVVTINGTCSTLPPLPNPYQNTAKATAPNGISISPPQVSALCEVIENPMIKVSKNCMAKLVVSGGAVKVQVGIRGTVCNTSQDNTALTNVTATDDHAGTLSLSKTTLNPGECATYGKSYFPTALGTGTCFTDRVTASGTSAGLGKKVTDFSDAKCAVCPGDQCLQ